MKHVCRRFGLSTFWFVDVLVCRRIGLSTFWSVDVLVCRRFGLSTFWFVDVSVCRRFGLSTFRFVDVWFVDVLVVDVSVCRRFDQLPSRLFTYRRLAANLSEIIAQKRESVRVCSLGARCTMPSCYSVANLREIGGRKEARAGKNFSKRVAASAPSWRR